MESFYNSATREVLVGDMYSRVSDIVTYAINNNKKLIIWGCGKGGAFLRHIICDVDGRMDISYYIDEYIVLPCGCEQFPIFRSSLLQYLPNNDYIVLLSIRHDREVEKYLEQFGYEKGSGYYDIRTEIGGNYLEHITIIHPEIDFSYVTQKDRPDLYNENNYDSKAFDHSAIDCVFKKIVSLPCEKSFFDIGCGKGQMLLMAAMSGISKIGGIEFCEEIAEIAKRNIGLLGIEADIIVGDAIAFDDYDNYSIFFMYNPFSAQGVEKVSSKLLESQKRLSRPMFLIYGNPFYHREVISIGDINLYCQVKVDLYDPLLNIYRIGA